MKLDKIICLGGRLNGKEILGIKIGRYVIYPYSSEPKLYVPYEFKEKHTITEVTTMVNSTHTNLSYMFYNCGVLTTINGIDTWDTSNVTTMSWMFYNCKNLTSLDLSYFDTSNVTTMRNMFASCGGLTSLNIKKFNTSKVTDMSGMFSNCQWLMSLNLSNFNTNNVTDMGNMFRACHRLKTLNLSSFDLSKIIGTDNTFGMFDDCYDLTNLQAPKNIKSSISLQDCTNLTYTSLMSVINNLATVTTQSRIVFGTENYNKLTSEEIAIAENKGWTVLKTY